MKKRRVLALVLAMALASTLFGGCGKKEAVSTDEKEVAKVEKKLDEATEEEGPVELKWPMDTKLAEQTLYKKLMELVKERTGHEVKPILLPGEEIHQKITIAVMAGDQMDILYANEFAAEKNAAANITLPLEDLFEEYNYDTKIIFGDRLKKNKGNIHFLPSQRDVHVTLYNKDLFDKAGVPYPDNSTWTWDSYLEAAKAITALNDETFGSYMLEWDPYFTFSAKQKKIPAYKEDGTSNLDHPAWAESFKFFNDLGNVHKVQPDHLTYISKKLPYDAFSSGKYGMWVVGNWATCIPADKERYPRDWKVGIAIMPQVNQGEKISLGVLGGYSIISTTKHKKEAFEAITALAEDEWTIPEGGRIPARIDLTQEQQEQVAEMVIANLKEDISLDEIKGALFDPELDIVSEKIVGPGMSMIDYNLIPKIGELYATGQRTLEESMAELKEKADKAIQDDLGE